MNRYNYVACLAIAMLLTAPSTRALAETRYNGTSCVPYDADSTSATRGALIFNSRGTEYAICPAETDNTTNSAGLTDARMTVQGHGGQVTCTAVAYSLYHNVDDWVADVTTSPYSGNEVLEFGSTLTSCNNTSCGTYAIACHSTGSYEYHVLNYTVTEAN